MTKPKAIALVRVSTDQQAKSDRSGLEAQRVEIQRIAKAQDLEISEWVELEGVSGASVLADPQFGQILARLSSPDTSGVIVSAFDRLMRPESLADYGILDAFRETG